MECLTAAVLVVAVVVLILGYQKSKSWAADAEERMRRETESLRAIVFRLHERIADLERLAGVRPSTVPPAAPVPAPRPWWRTSAADRRSPGSRGGCSRGPSWAWR